jgi:hypothetical protein
MMKIAGRKHYVPNGIRDDNCRGMQLSGDVSISSELKLHQVGVMSGMKEAARRPVAGRREFADRHGDFVAGVAPGTVDAVLQHFVA